MKKIYLLFLSLGFAGLTSYSQVPGGVTDSLTCWLKANEGVTINGTNQVTNWTEYSNNPTLGNFSTQGVAISKPTHVAPIVNPNGVNFNPYIVFNSTAAPNSISSANAVAGLSFLDANNNTIFQVINLKHATNTGVWLKWQWASSPYSSPRLGNEINNGGNPGRVRLDFRTNNLFTAANILNQHTLMTQSMTNTQKIIRLKGNQDAVNTTTGTFAPGTNTGRLTLGAEPYGDDYPTIIDMAEVIIYKRALTPFEINKVESYLAIKYGVTLEQVLVVNNYYSSNGTVLWNGVNNLAHRNNITGIGRDDASALNQKQSKSINANTFVTMYKGIGYNGVFPATNALNTSSFSSNNSILLFGDDNGALILSDCADNGRIVRLNRTWRMEAHGSDGTATLLAEKSSLPVEVSTLIVADDPYFNVNVTTIPLADAGTALYAAHNFTGTKYFTFGATPLALNAKADTVCFGSKGNISSNPTGGLTPITYSWNTVPPQTTSSLSNVDPGTYTVTVTQGNGACSFNEIHRVIGSPSNIEVFNVEVTPAICTSNSGSITISGTGGTPPYTYKIDNGSYQFDGNFSLITGGRHIVSVKDAIGCVVDTLVQVPINDIVLTPTVETYDAWCDAGGGSGYAHVRPNSGVAPHTYFWNNGIGLYSNINKDLTKGNYLVTVTDNYGCKGDVKFEIKEIPCCTYHIPNAFSPNGDGLNDVFIGYSSIAIPHFYMQIFNRWGQTVFVSGNHDKGWDGKNESNGVDAENGVYFYQIEYRCPLQNEMQYLKGEVTLLR